MLAHDVGTQRHTIHNQCGVHISSIFLMSFIVIVGIVMYGNTPTYRHYRMGLVQTHTLRAALLKYDSYATSLSYSM